MALTYQEWHKIFALDWPGLWPWLERADGLRRETFGRQVSFCVILNAKSGLCSEDCTFCSQAARARNSAPHYPLLSREEMLAAARRAHAAGASRFSLVTSGRGILAAREQDALVQTVAAIRAELPLQVCASLGIVDLEFLQDLQAVGLFRYHHNLETAASFFPRICSTHTFAERVATVTAARQAGLSVCSGGIVGLGESVAQRWELAQTLAELGVDAVPLNFLDPRPGTPLASRPRLPPLEALQTVVAFRLSFPTRSLIICGGRQVTLRSLAPLVLLAGADGLMTGNYLTTTGRLPAEDLEMLADLGLSPAVGEAEA